MNRVLNAQNQILDMIARGKPLLEILNTLARVIEEQSGLCLCSILLADKEGKHLKHGAAPSLPEGYNRIVEGIPVADGAGSCGTAAYRRELVLSADISTDPRWVRYREVALKHGLRSCWSSPILASNGDLLGTYAMYFKDPEDLRAFDRQWLPVAAHLAGIAIERQKKEEDLRQVTEKLRALIQSAPLPIVAMNKYGHFQDWNPAAENLFGWTKEEISADPFLFIPVGRTSDHVTIHEQISTGKSISGLVLPHNRKDGSTIDVALYMSPIYGDDGETDGVVGMCVDMTERNRFIQVAAHELRNPMAGVKGILTLLQNELFADQLEREELYQTMEQEIERLSNTLNQILEAFRSGRGEFPFRYEPVNLSDVVKSALQRFLIARHKDRFRLNLPSGTALVKGDFSRLEDVFRNLIGNALKYSPADTLVSISLSLEPEDQSVVVAISDSGLGIPEKEIPLVFESFYRATNLANRDPGGMGLGLSICREIIKRHGGQIWVESREGEGSTFFVKLPMHQGKE